MSEAQSSLAIVARTADVRGRPGAVCEGARLLCTWQALPHPLLTVFSSLLSVPVSDAETADVRGMP